MLDRLPIATARLVLEPLGPAHAPALWDATHASLPELNPWATWAVVATPDTTAAYVADMRDQWSAGRMFEFAVCENGTAIGSMGLNVPHPRGTSASIGYWIRSDRAGRGYTTEAARGLVDFAFGPLKRARLELRAGVANLPSQRVAEKLGFQREGLLRQAAEGANGPYDCYIYGLLPSDPRP